MATDLQSYAGKKINSQFELIKFVEGIPVDENEIVSDVSDVSAPHLIVFDDMLGENDKEKNQTVVYKKRTSTDCKLKYITQNMFQQSKSSRTISLNSRYMILFRNERDKIKLKL